MSLSDRESTNALSNVDLFTTAHTYYFPGIVIGKDMLTLDHSEVERVFAVNCTSHFGMIKHFLPAMLRNDDPCVFSLSCLLPIEPLFTVCTLRSQLPGGVVVTMASVMGFSGAALLSDYCASKHAVLGMAESLRFELMTFGAKSVRSLAVCPFAVS